MQGDPVSRRADPPSPDRQLSKAIRLTHTPSHANQWDPTGSQAATQTDNNGRAVMSQPMSIGLNFSVDSVAGATAATPGGALSTSVRLRKPTDGSSAGAEPAVMSQPRASAKHQLSDQLEVVLPRCCGGPMVEALQQGHCRDVIQKVGHQRASSRASSSR